MRVRLDSGHRVIAVSVALALSMSMLACKKEAATEPPQMDEAGESKSPADSDDPVAELAALEGRMRALGLPTASDKKVKQSEGEDTKGEVDAAGDAEAPAEEAPVPAGVQPTPPNERDVCGDLCSLSESICTLEVRICSLAEAHENDMTYADACERAVEDCEVAGEACDTCG